MVRHVHLYHKPFPSDPRFIQCDCGAATRAGRASENPCVSYWGRGPVGKTCKTCAHLRYFQQSRKWYKCSLRTDLTHGAKTDQRVKWEACARYTPRVDAVTGAYVERMEEI